MKLREVNVTPRHWGGNIDIVNEFRDSGMAMAEIALDGGDSKYKYQSISKAIKTHNFTDVACFVRDKRLYLKRV